MKADDATIEAMQPVYSLVLSLKEQTHRQEHVFKAGHYRKLARKFNRLTNVIHAKWLHKLTIWFASHHAEPDSTLVEVRTAEANEPADALVYSGDLLQSLNQAILVGCVAAKGDDDYVTGKLLHCLLCGVEKWRDCLNAELDQVEDLGAKLYLQRMK